MPGASAGEGLAYHSAAVASVLSQLARRAPALVEVAEDQSLWRQAFWACWLHDLGKAATGFQQVLRTSSRATWKHRHEVLSLAFLRWVTPPDADDFPWIAAAIASHHRDAPDILERYPPDSRPEDVDLDAMVAELDDESILGVAGWLRDKAPEWLNGSSFSALGVDAAWCGPRSVDPQVFRREAPAAILTALRAYEQLWQAHRAAAAPSGQRRHGVLLRGLLLLSDHLGSAHAPQLSPGIAIPGDAELLRRAGAPSPRVRSHQRGAAGTVGSVVLAAPTGSGKTEAALLWARRQCEDPGVVHRLVYLLPYQASLNAMHERLAHELLADVALVHGRAAQVLYRDLTSDGATSQQAERKARRAQDLARLHHPPVWVATPYQLLRAAYRLKQYETMWTALARNLIVVDEPHAYEPERLGLLLGLLRELVRAWDVRVCAMSATLPTWLRKLLVDSLAATLLPIDRALFAEFRRHRLALVPGEITEPATLATIVDQVRGGRSVLVAVNTVARAQLMRAALAEQLGPEHVSLLHSRFTGRDRLRKEQTVLAQLRAASPQSVEHAGLAVVATQVIEVSLDLDFDTIFSEPAPLEALAQRFGRVNRRGLKGVTPVHVLTAPKDGQHVYDPDLVQRTLKLLASVNGQTLDEALLSEYLDAVYAEDLANVFVRRVLASQDEFERTCIHQLRAFESDDGLEEQFDALFQGTEVLPASLEDDYRATLEESVLAAQTLLVPITNRQRWALGSAARWSGDLRLSIAEVPYDPEFGLLLPSRSNTGD